MNETNPKNTEFSCLSPLETVNELKRRLDQLKLANQKLQRNSRGSINDESALIHRSSIYEPNEPIHIRAQVTNTAYVLYQSITLISIALSLNFWTQRRY